MTDAGCHLPRFDRSSDRGRYRSRVAGATVEVPTERSLRSEEDAMTAIERWESEGGSISREGLSATDSASTGSEAALLPVPPILRDRHAAPGPQPAVRQPLHGR